MANKSKKMEVEEFELPEIASDGFELNDIEEKPIKVEIETKQEQVPVETSTVKETPNIPTVCCLRQERVEVRHIDNGKFPKKHVFFGGMAPEAVKTFSVPMLENGTFKNVLTNAEKAYLEQALGLEKNAMSVHKKAAENFWSDANPNGIGKVSLRKDNNFLDLSNPTDYIKYKILLANDEYIAPSLAALSEDPKDTYQFVIVSEGAETKLRKSRMDYMKDCYKLYGKVEDDKDTLRLILETLDGRPTATNIKLDFLQSKCGEYIEQDPRGFYNILTDPYLKTKVLIKRAVEFGVISVRNGFYYDAETGQPLCEENQDSTLQTTAEYLNAPKNQGTLLALQAKVK